MSTAMTAAGESLVARLQAEGRPLIIDRLILAHIPSQDHTQPITPGVTVPAGNVVYDYAIPPEYRTYVNPNQVVYSSMLGSDVGDFTFNWQGLYCTEHKTLVAVATFPALEKRRYDVSTGKTGNNLTRNFLLTFTGARELTGLTISADVWQLDFTVRLLGMDERERLSNFDLYGQGYFEGEGWLLKQNGGNYVFGPGLGYVGGIRIALGEPLPLAVTDRARDVWLSVCLKPVGSDRMAEAAALQVDVGAVLADDADETGLMHYRQLVARIEANGTVTDLRPKRLRGVTPENTASVPSVRKLKTTAPLTGGGDLSEDRTLGINAVAAPTVNTVILRDAAGRAQVAAPVAAADIARKADVDAVAARTITVAAPLTGGGSLTGNRAIGINAAAAPTANFVILRDAAGRAQVAAPAAAADIARKADVDAAVTAAMFLKGTRLLFQQSAAPTGWVKETNTVYNDAALRMVTGNVATGGTGAFSSLFGAAQVTSSVAAGGTVGGTTLNVAQMPNHDHGVYGRAIASDQGAIWMLGESSNHSFTTATTRTGGSTSHTHTITPIAHTHTLTLAVKRVDVIICIKS